jgi:biopolymer transport protein ExbD
MRLRRPASRAPVETIVAMIDVVFFLLVFFMLIGRLDATAPFEVLPPLALSGSDMPAGGAIISVAADGRHALDGVELAPSVIFETLAARAETEPMLPVRINGHQSAPLGLILPLIAQLEEAGLLDVGIVVSPNPP